MAITTERTSFTKDIQGRYLCNNLAEVDAWKSTGGRPFDFIIVGGGTFGSAIAEHLWFRQKQSGGGLRTLVVDAGLFTVPEHVQNTGIQGFGDPANPFFLDENLPQPEPPRNEVWGIPWKSTIPFKGLAYTLGGRSLYWGGWSPRLLDEEMSGWPANTVADLNSRYFDESSRQIGVDEANDFIFGELQNALRRQLFDNLSSVPGAITLDALPPSPLLKPGADPAQLLGLSSSGGLSQSDLLNMLKLEAPLAVQARPPHAGFFPLNKFSVVPLLMKAARTAASDSNGNDSVKEFMVLPDTHVLTLRTVPTAAGTWRISGVETSRGPIDLAPGGAVIMALGTIENARLALASFDATGLPTLPLIGKNLIAHLRSNLVIRVPRSAIPGLSSAVNELQTAAMFVKGRATRPNGDLIGHFHLQIAASGGGNTVGGEDELYRKVPDVDFYDQLRTSTDTHIAIAIRGLGEMEPADPADPAAHPSRVDLSARTDEYGVRRASIALTPTQRDCDLWAAMDAAMQKVAATFANGQPMQVLQSNQDGLGTTHHEAGTLWMGTDPAASVTDGNGRFHHTENLYAAGPALFPSIGSPNPMLTGIALSRRTGDLIMAPPPVVADAGFETLFDGNTLGDWTMSTISNQPGRNDPGSFRVRRGVLETRTGTDLGLLWLKRPTPPRYVLRLQWMLTAPDDNSGVFIGFPDPRNEGYDNTAYVGVNFGFEIQIDELARPDRAPIHRTGAVYSFKGPTDGPLTVHPAGEWNSYEITVDGADITVVLNGQTVNIFHFAGDPQSPRRGLPSTAQDPRFIGLQTHTGRVLFRNIQWKPLEGAVA
ncbi:choline dehydrogenase-like flavoprotein [Bradyrhizobium ottawaense]|uniref:family 16 glycoside hydrolase n=1 Tax=Bradyrhizobium ottawaense TaxID=931866 RepID=UPI003834CAFE